MKTQEVRDLINSPKKQSKALRNQGDHYHAQKCLQDVDLIKEIFGEDGGIVKGSSNFMQRTGQSIDGIFEA